MDREECYARLSAALLRSNFRFRAADISQEDLTTERDKLSSSVRKGIDVAALIAPIVSVVANVDIPDFKLRAVFDQDGVQRCLDGTRDYGVFVCCKYVLAQPVILVVVEADALSRSDVTDLIGNFDRIVLQMRAFCGRIGGKIAGTRLGATGIVLFVFFDHSAAGRFIEHGGNRLVWHLFRQRWILPWVIDVSANRITRHSGPPVISRSILDADRLMAELFDT